MARGVSTKICILGESMSIPVACACGRRFKVRDDLAGGKVKCPGCGSAIGVAIPGLVIDTTDADEGEERSISIRSRIADFCRRMRRGDPLDGSLADQVLFTGVVLLGLATFGAALFAGLAVLFPASPPPSVDPAHVAPPAVARQPSAQELYPVTIRVDDPGFKAWPDPPASPVPAPADTPQSDPPAARLDGDPPAAVAPDPPTPAPPPARSHARQLPPLDMSRPVHVRGYTRKDGTYVRPHTRNYPRR